MALNYVRLEHGGSRLLTKGFPHLRSAGAVQLVLEGSAHDTFNDIVQLVALRYTRVMHYLRMFKPVSCTPPGKCDGYKLESVICITAGQA